MMHERRRYSEPCGEEGIRRCYAPEALAHDPTDDLFLMLARLLAGGRTWTCCSAWTVGRLILLNDATSENGAQEYAVFRDGVQVESLTCSWMSDHELAATLRALDAGSDVPVTEQGEVHVATSASDAIRALGGTPEPIAFGCRLADLRIGADHHGRTCGHCA